MTTPTAVVLLSGGLDSATALAVAVDEGYRVHALSVKYGQRHTIELECARRQATRAGVIDHRIVDVDLTSIGGSALTDNAVAVPDAGTGEPIPATYVPARNTIMLAIALGLAEVTHSEAIFCGVNAVDYSGYPDCRPEFLDAFQGVVNVATRTTVEGGTITLRAPLIERTKAGIIRLGQALHVDYGHTWSCYNPQPTHADDREQFAAAVRGDDILDRFHPCGVCDSCAIRAAAFAAVGTTDPALAVA